MPDDDMAPEKVEWELTPAQEKNNLPLIIPLFLGFLLFIVKAATVVLPNAREHLEAGGPFLIFIAFFAFGMILFALGLVIYSFVIVLSRIYSKSSEKISLSPDGVTLTNHRAVTKNYTWSDFSSFGMNAYIGGYVFGLTKVKGSLFSSQILIRCPQEKKDLVLEFISRHLMRKINPLDNTVSSS